MWVYKKQFLLSSTLFKNVSTMQLSGKSICERRKLSAGGLLFSRKRALIILMIIIII
jgi:hypothetical protein